MKSLRKGVKSVQSYQLKHFIVNFELNSHLFYHGQNIVDNFTKLSKMVFLWNVLHQFSRSTIKIWLLVAWLGTYIQFQAFRGFS